MSHLRDSNPRPAIYETAAIPTELRLIWVVKVSNYLILEKWKRWTELKQEVFYLQQAFSLMNKVLNILMNASFKDVNMLIMIFQS